MNQQVINSTDEQDICIGCGFCCDGTLFERAALLPGEKESGKLPRKIEENHVKTAKGEWFSLPCHYFKGKCSIYNLHKAHVCSAFRCKLLHKFSIGKLSKTEALNIVIEARDQRQSIVDLAKSIWNKDLSFYQITKELNDDEEKYTTGENAQINLLIIKIKIFNVLMTRFFKSKEEFNFYLNVNEPTEEIQ